MEMDILPNSLQPQDGDGDYESNFYDNIVANGNRRSSLVSSVHQMTVIDMEDVQDNIQEDVVRPEDGVTPGRTRSDRLHSDRLKIRRVEDGGKEDDEEMLLISKTVTEHVDDFFASTTLHGIRYVCNRGFNWIRRLLWLLGVLGMLAWMAYGILNSVVKYFGYPMSSIITVNYVAHLSFPVVTLCNYNQFRRSVMDPRSSALLQRLFTVHNDEDPPLNWTAYEQSVGIREWNMTHLALELAHQPEDLIQGCTWRTVERCGIENFTRVITDLGVCYSFNHHLSPRKTLEVKQPGSQNGLYLRLNVEQNEYTFSGNTGAGIKILMHQQHEPPLVKSLGFSVPPGFDISVSSRYTKVENLPWPYISNCTNQELSFSVVYTVPLCQHECKIKYVVNICGCRDYRYPGNAPLCTPQETFECIYTAEARFTANNIICDCPVPCHSSSFQGSASMAYWPNTHITEALTQEYGNITEQTLRTNLLDLRIYFEELSFEEIEQVPAYDSGSIQSDIGGYMGLLCGMSLITVIEFADCIIVTFCIRCRHRKKDGSTT